MKGYVINKSPVWMHAMKRAIGPGAKIDLNELFEQYGAKHGLNEGQEFANWLRAVKLPDINRWKIVLEDENVLPDTNTILEDKKVSNTDNIAPIVKKETLVSDVVNLSVRQARETLPKINDLKLLKYALQEANQLAGKESLCKIIRKRISDLQLRI